MKGQGFLEYAILIVVIGVIVAILLAILGVRIEGLFSSIVAAMPF